jgi:hypothetical protein
VKRKPTVLTANARNGDFSEYGVRFYAAPTDFRPGHSGCFNPNPTDVSWPDDNPAVLECRYLKLSVFFMCLSKPAGLLNNLTGVVSLPTNYGQTAGLTTSSAQERHWDGTVGRKTIRSITYNQ